MADQFYGPWESRSATSEEGATTTGWDFIEPANPWPLASQIRQLLGEDYELDPTFFEEIWTSGQPATVESRQKPRDRGAAVDFQSCTFAELSGLGNFVFTQESEWSHDSRPYAPSAMPSASYAANWLQEPLEYSRVRTDQASAVGSAASGEDAKDRAVFCSMQYQRACELLSVSTYSTEAQIKAAYHRMAGQWHPDRLERGSEELRALATKQMTAINEAYSYLRSYSPMACC